MVRNHIRFGGRVQGVGFRYTACRLAQGLGLTGWVRNLEDGDVEMEAQGDAAAIQRLIEGLRAGRFIRIDSIEREELPLRTDETQFREIW